MKQDSSKPPPAPGCGPERPSPAIPDHQLLRKIGHGSYGEVWLARHEVLNTYRAVKVVYRGGFSEDRAFDRELEGLREFERISWSHPSQLAILQVGRDAQAGYLYYAMELADDQQTGQRIDPDRYEPRTLRSEIKQRGRLPFAECLQIGLALTTALEHLHGFKLIHRDIKPSNVIFVHGLPKLADIGLVAALGEGCSFVGTEGYVPREGPGEPPADVYAMGKMLYEVMTGLSANDRSSLGPEEKYPSLPDDWASSPNHGELNELRRVVLHACEGDPKVRYQSAGGMRLDLELIQSGKTLFVRTLQRTVQRQRWVLAGMAMAAMLVLSIVGLWFFRSRAAEQERRRELKEIQIVRMRAPLAGWFTNSWLRLERASRIRADQEVLEQATASFAGLDARPVMILETTATASAAFAPDGRILVGGVGLDGTSLLIETNGARTELPVQGEGLVGWAPGGLPVQLFEASNGAVLRDARTGLARREFVAKGPEPQVSSSPMVLAVSPGISQVAAGVAGRVSVWTAGTGELTGQIATEATSLAFSPDGLMLGVGGADGTTRVYSVPGLAEVAVLPPALRGSPIQCLAFARDRVVRYGVENRSNSWLLATGDRGAGIVVWDLQRRQPRSFCRGSTWMVAALAFHPDGLTLASAGRNDVRIWDVTSGKLLLRLRGSVVGDSLALAFDDAGRRLICGGEPGGFEEGAAVTLWEIEPHRGIRILRGLTSPVRKVWLCAHSERIAALSDDWHLGVWEVSSGRLLFLFETPMGDTADSAGGCFDAKSGRFAFAAGQEACLFDIEHGHVLQKWQLAEGESDQLQLDAHGRWLLLRRERAAEKPKWISRLHELGPAGSAVLLHEQTDTNWSAQDLVFAPGGERFIVGNGGPKETNKMVRVFDAASGDELWRAEKENPVDDLRVSFDPTGRFFIYNDHVSGQGRLMRLADFQELGRTPKGCDAISPSGKLFARVGQVIESRDGVDRGFPLVMDYTGNSYVSSFSPDGKLFAWGTEEGVVLVADIQEVQRRLSSLRP